MRTFLLSFIPEIGDLARATRPEWAPADRPTIGRLEYGMIAQE